jgi:hypothetical protein
MATTRLEKNLPSILKRRTKSPAEKQAALNALFEYAGLADEHARFDSNDPQEVTQLLAKLGLNLTRKLIPAFRPSRAGGNSRMSAEFYEDLQKAGAVWGLLGPSVSPDEFYGAQFAQVIEQLRQEKGRKRMQVFRWLANEIEKVPEVKARQRMAMLPKCFRARTTSGSLKEAFDSIPKAVRDNPANYLGSTTLRSPFNFLGKGPGPGLLTDSINR